MWICMLFLEGFPGDPNLYQIIMSNSFVKL